LEASKFLRSGIFDVCVTNPPFGTKNNAGIDGQFVEAAVKVAPVCLSMHKTACRNVLMRRLNAHGSKSQVVAQMSFDLPKQYRFHKDSMRSIEVDLLQTERIKTNE
jgi:putative methylase